MSVQSGFAKIFWKWVAPMAGLAALSLAVFFYFQKPTPKSYRLRITAGNALGMRHQPALRLQGEVAQRNITFELVPSLGSEQSLDWVERRKVALALVQGALNSVSLPNELPRNTSRQSRADEQRQPSCKGDGSAAPNRNAMGYAAL
jgi:hypothetical protein